MTTCSRALLGAPLALLGLLIADAAPAAERTTVAVGVRPESVTRGWGGKYYVSVQNEKEPGDGVIKVIEGNEAKVFATGFDEPKGIGFTGTHLVVTDVNKVIRIDSKGQTSVLAEGKSFPLPVNYLNDLAVEPGGRAVYVTDMGANTKMRDPHGNLWALDSDEAKALPAIGRVYRIGLDGRVSLAVDAAPSMPNPNGVTAPTRGRLLIAEFFTGNVLEARGGKLSVLARGFRGGDGIEVARDGSIYLSSWTQGKVWKLDRRGKNERVVVDDLQSAADLHLNEKAKLLLVPDMKAGTLEFIPLP